MGGKSALCEHARYCNEVTYRGNGPGSSNAIPWIRKLRRFISHVRELKYPTVRELIAGYSMFVQISLWREQTMTKPVPTSKPRVAKSTFSQSHKLQPLQLEKPRGQDEVKSWRDFRNSSRECSGCPRAIHGLRHHTLFFHELRWQWELE